MRAFVIFLLCACLLVSCAPETRNLAPDASGPPAVCLLYNGKLTSALTPSESFLNTIFILLGSIMTGITFFVIFTGIDLCLDASSKPPSILFTFTTILAGMLSFGFFAKSVSTWICLTEPVVKVMHE